MNILDVAPSEESAPGAPEAPDADTNAAEAPTEETGNVQAEAPPPEETGTAQPAADQGWTAEEWELWTEAVRASLKRVSQDGLHVEHALWPPPVYSSGPAEWTSRSFGRRALRRPDLVGC